MEPFTRLAQRVGRDDQLTATARLLFAALDCFLDKRSGHCAPSLARLAGWLGRDPRTVRRALVDLEAAGYVAVARSSGRRNLYSLLPTAEQTGDNFVPGTPDNFVPGTPDKNVPGLSDSDLLLLKNKRERTGDPPPVDLFANHYRDWFTAAVRYHLAELPDLVDWFPAAAADFFLAHSWHRSSDPETAVQWARRLAAIAADRAEVLEAFAWALGTPGVDASGRKVFSRPDHLARLTFRILAQRKRKAGPVAPGPATAAEAAPDPAGLAGATDAERVEVLELVGRTRPDLVAGGLQHAQACADQLARLRHRPPVEVLP